MSETRPAPAESGQKRITELRVSGHLMTLETGTFCVFHAPGSAAGDPALGLPGVRISLPPGPVHNQDQVSISTFRPDGWLGGSDSAALIRVASGPAQVLVTIYQAPGQGNENAPKLQVLRLSPEPQPASAAAPGQAKPADAAVPSGAGKAGAAAPAGERPGIEGTPDIIVHRQVVGDVASRIGEWAGERASRNWIEGFSILPPSPLKAEDIEYQAVLGRGWLSPWVNGGQFCGSRGMALPLLGLRLRLKGDAAERYDCVCHASFIDGTQVGPLPAGAACEAESLAPLEAFQIIIEPKAAARRATPAPAPAHAKAQAAPPVQATPAAARMVPAKAKPMAKSAPAKPVAKGKAAAPSKPAAAKPAAKARPSAAAKRPSPSGTRAR